MTTRRDFLQSLLIGTGTTMAATATSSAWGNAVLPQAAMIGERSLNLYNIHTGEFVNQIYWQDGQYIQEGLDDINVLLRDFRTREVSHISRNLLDDLHDLQTIFNPKQPISIISGYRSPKTNAQLRKNGGVAKRSLHMQGKAIDIRLPGINLKHVQKAAIQMQRGGVGIYTKSNFVHLDTGRVRRWGY